MFVVASDSANTDILKGMFKPYNGVTRYYATIQAAIDAVEDDRCDVIYVAPGHTETITSQIDVDSSGLSIIGLGHGSLRPTITVNGAIDGFDISAANVVIDNLLFGNPGTDAQTSIFNVDAANCTIRNIEAVGSTTAINIVDMITLTANADDCHLENIFFHNSTVAVNSFISLEGAASRVHLKNIKCFGDVDTAGIIDGAKVDYLFMEDVQVAVVGTTKPAITLDSNPEGMARNCFFAGTHGTLATNANLGNLMRVDNIKVLEETDNSASAAIIPAVDSD